MANDIFTGGASGDATDWNVGTWSGDNPPTSTDTVEEQGAGVDNLGSLTVGGLVLDSGASLSVSSGVLTVTGAQDTTFGGANSTLTISGATSVMVDSAVTSATGTVNVENGGSYIYEGSGAAQTLTAGGPVAVGILVDAGAHDDNTITLQTDRKSVV